MKHTLIILGIILLGLVTYITFSNRDSTTNASYTDSVHTYISDDTQFMVQYSDNSEVALISLSGMQYELPRVISASGAKYANADNSVVFWEKGNEATLELNGEVRTGINISENNNLLTFNIAPEKVSCVGVAPMECLVVNGEYFYESIAGFTFESGYEYELLVQRTGQENVPADANKYQYTLVKMMGKTEALTQEQLLTANSWHWKETRYNNDTNVAAKEPDKFLITFNADGTVSATTDCNNGMGRYDLETGLTFGPMAATKKACLGETQESEFFAMLNDVNDYLFTEDGDLVLLLKLDTGSVLLTPAR